MDRTRTRPPVRAERRVAEVTRRAWAVVVVGVLAVAGAAAWLALRDEPSPRRVFVLVGAVPPALRTDPDGSEFGGWVNASEAAADPDSAIVFVERRPAWLRPLLERWHIVDPPSDRCYFGPLPGDGSSGSCVTLTVVRSVDRPSGVWLEAVESLTELAPGDLADPAIAGRWRYQPAGYVAGLALTLAPDGSLRVDAPQGGARGVRWGASKDRLFLEFADVSDDLSSFVDVGLHSLPLSPNRKSFATGGDTKGWREE